MVKIMHMFIQQAHCTFYKDTVYKRCYQQSDPDGIDLHYSKISILTLFQMTKL